MTISSSDVASPRDFIPMDAGNTSQPPGGASIAANDPPDFGSSSSELDDGYTERLIGKLKQREEAERDIFAHVHPKTKLLRQRVWKEWEK